MLENFTRELEMELFTKAREIDGENIKNAIAGNPTIHNPYRETLIMQVHQAVYYMVKQRRGKTFGAVRDDYIGIGMVAIVEAYRLFDHTKGFRWMTYACDVLWKRFSRWDLQNKLVRKFKGEIQQLGDVRNELSYEENVDHDPKFSRADLEECCGNLTEQERTVLFRRLYGEKLREIGADLNLSRERIRQVEAKAKEKVSHALRQCWSDYEFH